MPREESVLTKIVTLVENRIGLGRRKTDQTSQPQATSQNGNGHTCLRVCRWVQRDGKTVRFTQGIGPFQGRMHVHYLPTLTVAQAFAAALLRTDEEGYPAPIDPIEWAAWQEEYSRF